MVAAPSNVARRVTADGRAITEVLAINRGGDMWCAPPSQGVALEKAHVHGCKVARDSLICCPMLTSLPNLLTLSRIAAIPVMVVFVALRQPAGDLGACIVFSLAGITDYFDGHIARRRVQTSNLGRMLDPIADKLLVGAAIMLLAGQGRLSAWGLYPALVILLREILVSGLREYLAGLRVGLPVTQLAKWKTGFQMGALGTLLAGNDTAHLLHIGWLPVSFLGELQLWIAAALTLWTGWDYLTAGLRHASAPPPAGKVVRGP